jgi:hypothetical protein
LETEPPPVKAGGGFFLRESSACRIYG